MTDETKAKMKLARAVWCKKQGEDEQTKLMSAIMPTEAEETSTFSFTKGAAASSNTSTIMVNGVKHTDTSLHRGDKTGAANHIYEFPCKYMRKVYTVSGC